MEQQIEILNQQKPAVEKQMIVGEQSESRNSDAIDWQKELELFIQADINKPAYRQSYEVSRPDSLTFTYVLKNGEDLPVQFLKVILDDQNRQPARIEAKIVSKNPLYESEKNLIMQAAALDGKWRLRSYHIYGFQELIISERKPFDVKVNIQ
ncbi:hypothetical protein [Arundinibacter roseus]|uniref:Uncharacterized protein n=1 Tax=Arundinibacter roseus TaxID=2070510 RepID=A0A4R4KKJ7_9BACT|nr:hypothetical protein [Arundinibacter roseus]TDB68780.1 hypothetical protein EZE20_00080 [Arundinibacter roseus]